MDKQVDAVRIPGKPVTRSEPHPPSIENLRAILLRAIELGNVNISEHFGKRCNTRSFSTLDAQIVLEDGKIIAGPMYDATHYSWKCEIFGRCEGRNWNLVIALDCSSDYLSEPRITYVTVHRMNVKRAKRKKG